MPSGSYRADSTLDQRSGVLKLLAPQYEDQSNLRRGTVCRGGTALAETSRSDGLLSADHQPIIRLGPLGPISKHSDRYFYFQSRHCSELWATVTLRNSIAHCFKYWREVRVAPNSSLKPKSTKSRRNRIAICIFSFSPSVASFG